MLRPFVQNIECSQCVEQQLGRIRFQVEFCRDFFGGLGRAFQCIENAQCHSCLHDSRRAMPARQRYELRKVHF